MDGIMPMEIPVRREEWSSTLRLADVRDLVSSDAAAQEGMFGHVNDMAYTAAEGGICVREEFIGLTVGNGMAGPVMEVRGQGRGLTEHKHIDMELVAQKILKGGRVAYWRVMNLGRGNGVGSQDTFSFRSLQFELDALLF
jgi:hypothetical protein